MVQYLHFRILKFPLKLWAFVKSKALFGFPPCGGHTLTLSPGFKATVGPSTSVMFEPAIIMANLQYLHVIYTVYPLVN